MPLHSVSESAEVSAPASVAYGLIADYHSGHPSILPKPPFVGIDVEKGGIGAGTIILVRMRLLGFLPGSYRAEVTEPEPGRLLAETDLSNGRETTFTIEQLSDGRCRVTIETTSRVAGGPLGRLQGWMLERLLRPMFVKELRLLGEIAPGRA